MKKLFILTTIAMLVLVGLGCNLKWAEEGGPTTVGALCTDVVPTTYKGLHWIIYTPTEVDPTTGVAPTEAQILGDLFLLRASGFDGIITTTSVEGYDMIPEYARQQGFHGVMMGVSDPNDTDELNRAIAKSYFVDAYVVGSCGLGEAYTIDQLGAAIETLNTYCEVVTALETNVAYCVDYTDELVEMCEFMAPVVNSYESGYKSPVSAAGDTVQKYIEVRAVAAGKVTMMFGVGYPTEGGEFASEEMQMVYYQNMPVDFAWAHHEAFDQPWREGDTAPYYGLFYQNRNPKQYIASNPFDTPEE